MKLTGKLLLGTIVPAVGIMLAGSVYQQRAARTRAVAEAQQLLDESAKFTARLVDRVLRSVGEDLLVLSTQSSFIEYAMYTRVGLLDDAEQQRIRIEEAGVQLLKHRAAYQQFEYHGRDGQGIVRVDGDLAQLKYTSATEAPWFQQAMREEHAFVPLANGSIRIARRVRIDGLDRGVVSVRCSANQLLGRTMAIAARSGPERMYSIEGETDGLRIVAGYAEGEERLRSKSAMVTIAEMNVEVEQTLDAAIRQYVAATHNLTMALLVVVGLLTLLVAVAMRWLFLGRLRRIHAKAIAFRTGQ